MKRKICLLQINVIIVLILLYAVIKSQDKRTVGLEHDEPSQNNVDDHQVNNQPGKEEPNTRGQPMAKRYPNYNECSVVYESANMKMETGGSYDYSQPADESLHDKTIVRGVLFYFHRQSVNHFMPEFRWVYRSWIEMLKSSPKQWHTDLIFFVDLTDYKSTQMFDIFEQFGCRIDRPRTSKTEKSMCILLHYVSINTRKVGTDKRNNDKALFRHLFDKVDIFSDEPANLELFYTTLQGLHKYGYLDSVLMAFDGYKQLKDFYDFVLRSDSDVFLTPLFGKWIPRRCNDFVVGGGGYSTAFNTQRLGRIAHDLDLNSAYENAIGSTWYSTPKQIRMISYVTLLSMVYLYENEFTGPERDGQVGTINWPDWHYGVLLLYGGHIAVNHFWAENEIKFVKLHNLLDYPTGNTEDVNTKVHLHVYQGEDMFSKFMFKENKYDQMNVSEEEKKYIKTYCLAMALESKRFTAVQLKAMRDQIN